MSVHKDKDPSAGRGSQPARDDLGWAGKSAVHDLERSVDLPGGVRLKDTPDTAPLPEFKPTDARYEVVGLIGVGGMGSVYLAFDHDLKRRIAVKVLNPRQGLSSPTIRRFLEEVQATAQLEHPNIVPVYDIGRAEDGRAFYTMRYVKGTSLEDVLADLARRDAQTVRRWSLFRLIQLVQQVAMALDFAHNKGVIHRDLKPSNVMLGTFGEVVVMDWGLARVLGRPEWPKRKLVGTPAYMSPEQATGEPADERSDVYALGVTLYRVLTLHLPFETRELETLLERIRIEEPPRPKKLNPRVPEALEAICLKAMEKDPARRYQRARDFHDALLTFLEGLRQRSVRHGVAEEEALEGIRWLERYHGLRAELTEAESRLRRTEASTPGWAPLDEKRPLIQLRLSVEQTAEEVELAFSHAVDHLSKALGALPSHERAREALADLYYERFTEAERTGDQAQARSCRRLVMTYHDGRYSRQLTGEGELRLDTDPSGASVALYRFEERDLVLEPVWQEHLGLTPLKVPLPMGSYLLLIELDGYAMTRYPVYIERLGKWEGVVKLYNAREIGQGFIYVPGGPFIQGGDRGTKTGLPRLRPTVDDVFVAEFPVTGLQYLEFLNDLARSEPEEAKSRAPRRGPEESPYWTLGEDGRFHAPQVDREGDRHDLNWPVLAVSWHDAMAYCEWRSGREGRHYDLPTEAQWEKAARGVDGRVFPWGNRFDPGLTNMKESRERAGPVPVGGFAQDLSPYGVRDLAGNAEEWCKDPSGDSRGSRIVRGGAWSSNQVMARAAFRSAIEPHLVAGIRGFRVVSNEPAVRRPAPTPHHRARPAAARR